MQSRIRHIIDDELEDRMMGGEGIRRRRVSRRAGSKAAPRRRVVRRRRVSSRAAGRLAPRRHVVRRHVVRRHMAAGEGIRRRAPRKMSTRHKNPWLSFVAKIKNMAKYKHYPYSEILQIASKKYRAAKR